MELKKKINLKSLLLAGAMVSMSPNISALENNVNNFPVKSSFEVNELLALNGTWQCYASSPNVSWRIGDAYTIGQAKRIALHECSIRTPRNLICSIDYCE